MLTEALKYLFQQSMDTRRVGIRKIETPGGMPGQVLIANANTNGVYEVSKVDYDLAAPKFLARTIAGFCDFLFNGLSASEGKSGWHVMIGDDAINGFLLEPLLGYNAAPNVTMKLTPTDQWLWVKKLSSMEPKLLARWIKKCWPQDDFDSGSIRKLLPLLSRLSVQITNKSTQNNSQNNESLGMDVTKQLTVGDNAELPEMVSCSVKMYKEVNVTVNVTMNCYFDFDQEKVVLDPIDDDLIRAEDNTNAEIVKIISAGDPKPIVSQVKVTNIQTSNEGVRVN